MAKPPAATRMPRCKFLPEEVAEMNRILKQNKKHLPSRSVVESLSNKFNSTNKNTGRAPVLPKQISTWFHNTKNKLARLERRSSERASEENDCPAERLLAERLHSDELQFEAISNKDGAWYDIKGFLGHRFSESGQPEVWVRYVDQEDDDWVDVSLVRRRSTPCESFDCLAVYPGDRVLCYQEGTKHALYYDARVIDVQRKRHDARGCRCRFWIRYDHDQFEEIVPLKNLCRRPETDGRLKKFPKISNSEGKHSPSRDETQKSSPSGDYEMQKSSPSRDETEKSSPSGDGKDEAVESLPVYELSPSSQDEDFEVSTSFQEQD